MSALDPLWGAILESIEFDLVPREVRLRILAPSKEHGDRGHLLILAGVSDFSLTNQIDWDYVETTEFYLTREDGDRMRLDIILWVEDSRLVVVFERASLNGESLDPEEEA
jgi:hypothetical protein